MKNLILAIFTIATITASAQQTEEKTLKIRAIEDETEFLLFDLK